jgi:hypothetical protein
MSAKHLIAIALGLSLAGPSRAADITKYMPDKASMYVHINVKQLLTAPVVRKALPMAVDKYGDQLLPLIQLAKQFNPAAPDVPEEQVKKAIDELKKEATIAAGFDKAKDAVTDVIVAGDANDDEGKSMVVVIKVPDAVTGEALEAMTKFIPQDQLKSKQYKKDKVTIHEFEVQQAPVTMFVLVPEPGVICLTMNKESAEKAAGRANGDSKPTANAELDKLRAKRKPTDFLFAAGIKGDGDEREIMLGSLVLDKDVSGSMTMTYGTEEKAKKEAEELSSHLDSAKEKLKEWLSDKKDALNAILEKAKTKRDGKTVSAEFSVSGSTIEKLLAKDN